MTDQSSIESTSTQDEDETIPKEDETIQEENENIQDEEETIQDEEETIQDEEETIQDIPAINEINIDRKISVENIQDEIENENIEIREKQIVESNDVCSSCKTCECATCTDPNYVIPKEYQSSNKRKVPIIPEPKLPISVPKTYTDQTTVASQAPKKRDSSKLESFPHQNQPSDESNVSNYSEIQQVQFPANKNDTTDFDNMATELTTDQEHASSQEHPEMISQTGPGCKMHRPNTSERNKNINDMNSSQLSPNKTDANMEIDGSTTSKFVPQGKQVLDKNNVDKYNTNVQNSIGTQYCPTTSDDSIQTDTVHSPRAPIENSTKKHQTIATQCAPTSVDSMQSDVAKFCTAKTDTVESPRKNNVDMYNNKVQISIGTQCCPRTSDDSIQTDTVQSPHTQIECSTKKYQTIATQCAPTSIDSCMQSDVAKFCTVATQCNMLQETGTQCDISYKQKTPYSKTNQKFVTKTIHEGDCKENYDKPFNSQNNYASCDCQVFNRKQSPCDMKEHSPTKQRDCGMGVQKHSNVFKHKPKCNLKRHVKIQQGSSITAKIFPLHEVCNKNKHKSGKNNTKYGTKETQDTTYKDKSCSPENIPLIQFNKVKDKLVCQCVSNIPDINDNTNVVIEHEFRAPINASSESSIEILNNGQVVYKAVTQCSTIQEETCSHMQSTQTNNQENKHEICALKIGNHTSCVQDKNTTGTQYTPTISTHYNNECSHMQSANTRKQVSVISKRSCNEKDQNTIGTQCTPTTSIQYSNECSHMQSANTRKQVSVISKRSCNETDKNTIGTQCTPTSSMQYNNECCPMQSANTKNQVPVISKRSCGEKDKNTIGTQCTPTTSVNYNEFSSENEKKVCALKIGNKSNSGNASVTQSSSKNNINTLEESSNTCGSKRCPSNVNNNRIGSPVSCRSSNNISDKR